MRPLRDVRAAGKQREGYIAKSWRDLRNEKPIDERQVAALDRMMHAEQTIYWLWEQRSEGMNWAGEALSTPVEEQDCMWLAGLGEKVAALGGHLELVAVLL